MAKRDEVFPSKYLKSADLGDKPLVVRRLQPRPDRGR